MAQQRVQAPQVWQFNDDDRAVYHDRYWRCPVRLVREGLWARLWRMPDTTRGGGAMTSLLPVLACHTWAEKDGATKEWTGWAYLSRRRMALLAGINKDTATAAIEQLESLGLLDVERRPRAKYEGGYKTYYRLAASLYPHGDEPYASIPAHLFYGGTWFLLPSSACRHLYVVLACLDPIGDEEAYLARIAEDIEDEWDRFADDLEDDIEDDEAREVAIKAMVLAKRRASASASIRELESSSGLQRRTVIDALQALTVPLFGDRVVNGVHEPTIPLIAKGKVPPKTPTWYAPDRRAQTWFWHSAFLNTPAKVATQRRQLWPKFARR